MPSEISIKVVDDHLIKITSVEYEISRLYDLENWTIGAAVENFIDTEL